MNVELFLANWAQIDRLTQVALKNFVRSPTERNACYITGYIGALADRDLLHDASYWLAITGRVIDQDAKVSDAIRHAETK